MPGFERRGGGSLAARREMRDHRASLTRRWIETKPACQLGSYGVQWSTLKENNYGCKRYCAESRSMAAKFLVGLLSQQDRARISACCWRGLQKFLQWQLSHIILQSVWHPPTHSPTPFYPLTQKVGRRIGLCLLLFVFPQSKPYSHDFQSHLEDFLKLLIGKKFSIRRRNRRE